MCRRHVHDIRTDIVPNYMLNSLVESFVAAAEEQEIEGWEAGGRDSVAWHERKQYYMEHGLGM